MTVFANLPHVLIEQLSFFNENSQSVHGSLNATFPHDNIECEPSNWPKCNLEIRIRIADDANYVLLLTKSSNQHFAINMAECLLSVNKDDDTNIFTLESTNSDWSINFWCPSRVILRPWVFVLQHIICVAQERAKVLSILQSEEDVEELEESTTEEEVSMLPMVCKHQNGGSDDDDNTQEDIDARTQEMVAVIHNNTPMSEIVSPAESVMTYGAAIQELHRETSVIEDDTPEPTWSTATQISNCQAASEYAVSENESVDNDGINGDVEKQQQTRVTFEDNDSVENGSEQSEDVNTNAAVHGNSLTYWGHSDSMDNSSTESNGDENDTDRVTQPRRLHTKDNNHDINNNIHNNSSDTSTGSTGTDDDNDEAVLYANESDNNTMYTEIEASRDALLTLVTEDRKQREGHRITAKSSAFYTILYLLTTVLLFVVWLVKRLVVFYTSVCIYMPYRALRTMLRKGSQYAQSLLILFWTIVKIKCR